MNVVEQISEGSVVLNPDVFVRKLTGRALASEETARLLIEKFPACQEMVIRSRRRLSGAHSQKRKLICPDCISGRHLPGDDCACVCRAIDQERALARMFEL